MAERGDLPADVASRMPSGSYELSDPFGLGKIVIARLQHDARSTPFVQSATAAIDILSLHLSDVQGRTRLEGLVVGDGEIKANSISLLKEGLRADVSLSGTIDILHVFLPRAVVGGVAAEMFGRPVQPIIEGWIFDRQLRDLVLQTYRSTADPEASTFSSQELVVHMIEHLLVRHGSERTGATRKRRGGLPPHQLTRSLELIETQLACDLSLEELASQAQLSPYHFLRSFVAETGIPPHQWIIRRRIAAAKRLLCERQLSMAEIAEAVGYASQASMTATFTRVVGVSPGEWCQRRAE